VAKTDAKLANSDCVVLDPNHVSTRSEQLLVVFKKVEISGLRQYLAAEIFNAASSVQLTNCACFEASQLEYVNDRRPPPSALLRSCRSFCKAAKRSSCACVERMTISAFGLVLFSCLCPEAHLMVNAPVNVKEYLPSPANSYSLRVNICSLVRRGGITMYSCSPGCARLKCLPRYCIIVPPGFVTLNIDVLMPSRGVDRLSKVIGLLVGLKTRNANFTALPGLVRSTEVFTERSSTVR